MPKSTTLTAVLLFAAAASLGACKKTEPQTPNPAGGKAPQSKPKRPDDIAADPEQVLTVDLLRSHTRALSTDAMAGRKPGTAGAKQATGYIVTAMKDLGLQPGATDGFKQSVTMRAVQTETESVDLELEGKGKTIDLDFGENFVGGSFQEAGTHSIDAPLVFAGYGVTAPEYDWDDYEGIDVTDKVVVVFVGDPPVQDGRFREEAMTYYGRWTYKYERALQAGAAGCLVVHETEPASYGWNVVQNSWSGQRFQIVQPDGSLAPALDLQGWISTEAATELAKASGSSLEQWHEQALTGDFRAKTLPMKIAGSFSTSEERMSDTNVIGKIEGSKWPDQIVMLLAHWDHLGTREDAPEGEDAIFNGAIDNASGIAGLLGVAAAVQARVRGGEPPGRTLMFVATTAEEQGLLGARYLAEQIDTTNVVGVLNLDSMNVHGRTKTIEVAGPGQSTLEDVLAQVAKAQGRELVPDSRPEAGSYYRSDHFAFARKGVPALYFRGGSDFEEGGRERGEAVATERASNYHTVSDEYDPKWSFEGAEQDAEAVLGVMLRVADQPEPPAWKPGSEFEKLRQPAGQ